MKNFLKIEKNRVGIVLFILLLIQPFFDVLSFFMIRNEMTVVSTMLRMILFLAIVVYSFYISDNKKVYIIMCAVLGVFWAFHMAGCFLDGYQSIYQDAAMYARTIQMPLLTVCFITFFKKGRQIPKIIRTGFFCNYLSISGVILLSYAVGMPESTYRTGIGIKGWFAIGNAQSCIVALLAPLTVYLAVQVNNKLFFVLATLVCFTNMFFFGTKVTLYFIFITIISMLFFLIVSKNRNMFIYLILVVYFIVGIGGYKYSPSYQNQRLAGESFKEWDSDIAKIKAKTKKPANKNKNAKKRKINYDYYLKIYNLYNKDLVDRFGIQKVVKKYNFSTNAEDLIDNRNLKVNFSSLMMDEKNSVEHLFGFEYMDYIYNGNIYEPENDFPGIYFSNGIIGLGLYIVFLLYFVMLILKKLIKDFKGSFTLENGAVAVTFILLVGAAQMSGNVLRRPNVSIYLSLILAYIYYLCVLKDDSKKETKTSEIGDNDILR